MTTIKLTDWGDPYLDGQGHLVPIFGVEELRQRIINLFNTQVGSEPFFETYGFDYLGFVRNTAADKNMLLYYYAVNALGKDVPYGFSSVQNIACQVTGTTGIVAFDATDTSGITYPYTVGIL